MAAPITPTRIALLALAFCGNQEAKHKLRLDKLRRAEAEVFLSNLKPEHRKLSKKRLVHKFNKKYPL